uniref:Uncharacterized protein n=1 Tax=Palpitomonas bilix TaxID=652834 RepID=A0A7S3GFP8_9EUKA
MVFKTAQRALKEEPRKEEPRKPLFSKPASSGFIPSSTKPSRSSITSISASAAAATSTGTKSFIHSRDAESLPSRPFRKSIARLIISIGFGLGVAKKDLAEYLAKHRSSYEEPDMVVEELSGLHRSISTHFYYSENAFRYTFADANESREGEGSAQEGSSRSSPMKLNRQENQENPHLRYTTFKGCYHELVKSLIRGIHLDPAFLLAGGAVVGSKASLHVEVLEAKDLFAKDIGGTSDPYVHVQFGTSTGKTPVVKANLNPKFSISSKKKVAQQSVFDFLVSNPLEKLVVTVYDHDVASEHDFLGKATVELSTLLDQDVHDVWLKLERRSEKSRVSGSIHLRVCFTYSPLLAELDKVKPSSHSTSAGGEGPSKERHGHHHRASSTGSDTISLSSIGDMTISEDSAASTMMIQAGGPVQRAFRALLVALTRAEGMCPFLARREDDLELDGNSFFDLTLDEHGGHVWDSERARLEDTGLIAKATTKDDDEDDDEEEFFGLSPLGELSMMAEWLLREFCLRYGIAPVFASLERNALLAELNRSVNVSFPCLHREAKDLLKLFYLNESKAVDVQFLKSMHVTSAETRGMVNLRPLCFFTDDERRWADKIRDMLAVQCEAHIIRFRSRFPLPILPAEALPKACNDGEDTTSLRDKYIVYGKVEWADATVSDLSHLVGVLHSLLDEDEDALKEVLRNHLAEGTRLRYHRCLALFESQLDDQSSKAIIVSKGTGFNHSRGIDVRLSPVQLTEAIDHIEMSICEMADFYSEAFPAYVKATQVVARESIQLLAEDLMAISMAVEHSLSGEGAESAATSANHAAAQAASEDGISSEFFTLYFRLQAFLARYKDIFATASVPLDESGAILSPERHEVAPSLLSAPQLERGTSLTPISSPTAGGGMLTPAMKAGLSPQQQAKAESLTQRGLIDPSRLFSFFITDWIENTSVKLNMWAKEAVKMDSWTPLNFEKDDEEDSKTTKTEQLFAKRRKASEAVKKNDDLIASPNCSSSVVDMLTALLQAMGSFARIKTTVGEHVTQFAAMICQVVQMYASELQTRFVAEMQSSAPLKTEGATPKPTKKSLVKKFLSAITVDLFRSHSGKDKETARKKVQESQGFDDFYSIFVRLNNIEFAILKLDDIMTAMMEKLQLNEEGGEEEKEGREEKAKIREEATTIFFDTISFLKRTLGTMVKQLVDAIEEDAIRALQQGLGDSLHVLEKGELGAFSLTLRPEQVDHILTPFFNTVEPQLVICHSILQQSVILRLLRVFWSRIAKALEVVAFEPPPPPPLQKEASKKKEKEVVKDEGKDKGKDKDKKGKRKGSVAKEEIALPPPKEEEADESLVMMARASRLHQILDRLAEFFHAGGEGIPKKAIDLHRARIESLMNLQYEPTHALISKYEQAPDSPTQKDDHNLTMYKEDIERVIKARDKDRKAKEFWVELQAQREAARKAENNRTWGRRRVKTGTVGAKKEGEARRPSLSSMFSVQEESASVGESGASGGGAAADVASARPSVDERARDEEVLERFNLPSDGSVFIANTYRCSLSAGTGIGVLGNLYVTSICLCFEPLVSDGKKEKKGLQTIMLKDVVGMKKGGTLTKKFLYFTLSDGTQRKVSSLFGSRDQLINVVEAFAKGQQRINRS